MSLLNFELLKKVLLSDFRDFWRLSHKRNYIADFKKLSPPSFEDSTNPLEVEEWIRQMDLEHIFEFLRPKDEKVVCTIFMLKKGARNWWETTKRAQNVGQDPMGRARFKELFLTNTNPLR